MYLNQLINPKSRPKTLWKPYFFRIGLMVILNSMVYKHAGNIFQIKEIRLNKLKIADNSQDLQFG